MLLYSTLPSISDPTLTTDSVAEAMKLVKDWKSLQSNKYAKNIVPTNQLREIQQRCSTKTEIANECASYYVHYHPQPSLTQLAIHLYSKGELAAVEKLKPFLPLRGQCQGISYAMLVYSMYPNIIKLPIH